MTDIVILKLHLILLLLACHYTQSQHLLECTHPTNFSDFNAMVINNTAVMIGGSSEKTVEIWTKDIMKNGLDINKNCWTKAPPSSSNTIISSFEHGVGFPITSAVVALQAGDYDTSSDGNMITTDNSTISSNLTSNDTNVVAIRPASLMLYDLIQNTWSINPVIQGIQPSPRARASVAVNATTNTAWFFGGRSTSTTDMASIDPYFNSFYSFNMKTFTWDWPKIRYSGGHRPARYGHTSNLISERVFVLGGKMVIHSTDTNQWVMTSAGDFQSVLVFDTVTHQSITAATFGDVPPARYSFTTVNAPDGKSIVLFGGQNVSSEQTFDASNDIYLLDTCSLNWSKPEVRGTPPIPRAGHQAILYHNNQYMIVLMGMKNYTQGVGRIHTDDIAILDMNTWTWISTIPPNITDKDESSISSRQQIPKCRFSFPAVVPDDDGDNSNDNNTPTTLLSSNNEDSASARIKKLAFGITFGVLGFALFTTAIILYLLKLRKEADPTRNPRWLPSNVILFDKKTKKKASTLQEDVVSAEEAAQPQQMMARS